VFSGSVVPILNKLLVSARFGEYGQNSEFVTNSAMPSIVKVEPTGESQQHMAPQPIAEPQQTEEVNESFEDGDVDPIIGKKVAREFTSILLNGVITDDHNGSYNTRFTDGRSITMNIDEVKEAMKLYESELKKLLETNVSNHVIEKPVTVRRPVVVEGGEIDTEETELIYEEEYDGEVPNILVGLQFPKRNMSWYSQADKTHHPLPLWKFVLRKLSEKLLEQGVASTRELLNFENSKSHE
jgi:hypothetical protein